MKIAEAIEKIAKEFDEALKISRELNEFFQNKNPSLPVALLALSKYVAVFTASCEKEGIPDALELFKMLLIVEYEQAKENLSNVQDPRTPERNPSRTH